MRLRIGVIILLFTTILSGCSTPTSVVWKAQNVSFSQFRDFEILPLVDATNTNVDVEILSFWNEQLTEQFKERKLQLIDNPQNREGVVIVKSLLLMYEQRLNQSTTKMGQRNRVLKCKILTILIDKSTSQDVAKISTVIESGTLIHELPYSSYGKTPGLEDKGAKENLKRAAASVAQEIAEMTMPM